MNIFFKKLAQTVIILASGTPFVRAKEIALTFDDAPMSNSKHFESSARTEELIRKLKSLEVPAVIIFANPCKKKSEALVLKQLQKYKDAGHIIGNHTCSHPRLDDSGYTTFSTDAESADKILTPLFSDQKFFRFPFLNEGTDVKLRDQMREWLKTNNYRNGLVSVDTDDYIFSSEINKAKKSGNKIDYKMVKKLFVAHLVGAANFYDKLAVDTLGYSPKHVMLLQEMEATVMFIDALVLELRKQGWKIISANEAYKDRLYSSLPKNTDTSNGIIAQLASEKTGKKVEYQQFDEIKDKLDKVLGLKTEIK